MKSFAFLLLLFVITIGLPSCEFSCSVGNKKDEVKGTAVVKDGARIYNDIQLTAANVKVEKAYLVMKDGSAMPEGNLVDFKTPVNVQIMVAEGWKEKDGKVLLGASEKITAEDGTVILDEKDLFGAEYADGISIADAKAIGLSASVKLKEGVPPVSFTVSFRIWDKSGDGSIEGSYKLYSK
jgi:hypothetical protein